jgi:hypothetical protein
VHHSKIGRSTSGLGQGRRFSTVRRLLATSAVAQKADLLGQNRLDRPVR